MGGNQLPLNGTPPTPAKKEQSFHQPQLLKPEGGWLAFLECLWDLSCRCSLS